MYLYFENCASYACLHSWNKNQFNYRGNDPKSKETCSDRNLRQFSILCHFNKMHNLKENINLRLLLLNSASQLQFWRTFICSERGFEPRTFFSVPNLNAFLMWVFIAFSWFSKFPCQYQWLLLWSDIIDCVLFHVNILVYLFDFCSHKTRFRCRFMIRNSGKFKRLR